MAERVLTVNVGRATAVPYRGRAVQTGIFKGPVEGRVMLGELGFEGDEQADPTVHGGAEKAAYLYSADDYDWWSRELGHPLAHGEFGENVTVTGMADAEVRVGDTLRLGDALVQVTGPREPCFKLGIRMGDHRFPARFQDGDRMGFYVRVLQPGAVGAGDAVELVEPDPDGLTIAELHRLVAQGRGGRRGPAAGRGRGRPARGLAGLGREPAGRARELTRRRCAPSASTSRRTRPRPGRASSNGTRAVHESSPCATGSARTSC